ncbi:uncharacterized protein LOC143906736 [Temnothorax americanus]|uniref:uncharacterized protein LOC143906736 n=1 Tax=Temnothorax americanus TaxID=1964332 RepID=UPI004067FE3F
MSGLGKKKTSVKICRDENGQIIKTDEGILYEYADNDGNTTLKFLRTTHPSCSESSSTSVESESIMPCSTASFRNEESVEEENDSHGIVWTDNESKKLLELYFKNIRQIGHLPNSKTRNVCGNL